MLVHVVVVSRFKSNLFDELTKEVRNKQLPLPFVALSPGLLARNLDTCLQLLRIVCQDLGADTVLQRCDYFSSCCVVLRICRKHQHYVKRQTYRITLNLHVAFLHDIEESDLNLSRQIRQLVDCKNAAV